MMGIGSPCKEAFLRAFLFLNNGKKVITRNSQLSQTIGIIMADLYSIDTSDS